MSKLTIFFVVALVAYVNSGVPKAKKTPATDTNLGQLIHQVEDIVGNVSSTLQNVFPDTKEVTEDVIHHVHNFSANVQNIVTKLQSEVITKNKGAADNLLKETSTKLNSVIASFQEIIGKENTAKVNEITAQFSSGLKSAATEVENLAKALQPDLQNTGVALQNFTKGILNDFVEAVQTVKSQISSIPK